MTALLSLTNVDFRYRGATSDALSDVSLEVIEGRSLGIVGESGSGKTTVLSLLLGLSTPTAGSVTFRGAPLASGWRSALREFRRAVQPVFQDPYSSLDPRQRVDSIVAEPVRALGLAAGPAGGVPKPSAAQVRDAVAAALASVDLPADAATRYPHEFSGGQRQRIAIARALVTGPSVLLADEPVSALDVSTRLDVIALLDRLRREQGLTIVMVSHDLSVVAALCEQTAVLKDGRVVESGPTLDLLSSPTDPYTRALVSAIPRMPAS